MIDRVIETLQSLRLDVVEVDGTLNVSNGRGPLAHKANVDPTIMAELQRNADDVATRRLIGGYASGIKSVLMEPKRSRARQWSFVEAAGSILPTIEARSFVDGVRDAGGEEPWYDDLSDDLVLAWLMRLDHGMRVVTAPQFEEWGVSRDRAVAAARSLLFHLTRNLAWKSDGLPEGIVSLSAGDGWDSGRLLVVEDVYFGDVTSDWRFALPEPDVVLAATSVDARTRLREVARARFEEASYPLSDDVWRLDRGRPVPSDQDEKEAR